MANEIRSRVQVIGVVALLAVATSSCVGAQEASEPSSRDLAVLAALLKDQCSAAGEKYRIVSDGPIEPLYPERLPDDWKPKGTTFLAEELERRSAETWKWPRMNVCDLARIAATSEIEETFSRDRRIPPGWDFFYQAYPGADRLVSFSRPAFSKDGTTAVVYAHISCNVDCATYLYVELKLMGSEWRVTERASAGTP